MSGASNKRQRSRIERLRAARRRNADLKAGGGDNDDACDDTPIPKGILRKMMDVHESWQTCRRRICKRGRGCRGRDVQCAHERVSPAPRNPQKAARDQARDMEILQRMLKEKLAENERSKAEAPVVNAAVSKRKRKREADHRTAPLRRAKGRWPLSEI